VVYIQTAIESMVNSSVCVCVCVCICVQMWCKTSQTRVDSKVCSALAAARMTGRVWATVNATDELKAGDHVAFNTGTVYYYQHAIVTRVEGIHSRIESAILQAWNGRVYRGR